MGEGRDDRALPVHLSYRRTQRFTAVFPFDIIDTLACGLPQNTRLVELWFEPEHFGVGTSRVCIPSYGSSCI